jgi:hypothetical protein
MKKTIKTKKMTKAPELRSHYDFDYRKAKPNRFSPRLIPLDEDVSKVFNTPELVNNALRSIISAFPKNVVKKAVS